MSGESRRFDPPEVPVTPALRWVLARAYAVAGPGPVIEETEGDAALELALRFGLAERIAARQTAGRLVGELGPGAAAMFKRQRELASAQEMRRSEVLSMVDEAAAELRCPYAPLQGQALVFGAFAPEGSRPAAALDLLIPEGKLDALHKDLLRRGLVLAGEASDSDSPLLRHRSGGAVALHRRIPGVRLDAKRPATFEVLAAADLLGPPASAMRFRPRGDLRLPRRELLTAQALVVGLAQNGLSPTAFPGFLLLADLVDLAFRGSGGRASLASIAPWIAKEVRFEEADAALHLATALAAADPDLLAASGVARSPARLLLDHFHAGLTDPRYAATLKAQRLEPLLADRPLAMPRTEPGNRTEPRHLQKGIGESSRDESWLAGLGRVVSRPWAVVRQWLAARAGGKPRQRS